MDKNDLQEVLDFLFSEFPLAVIGLDKQGQVLFWNRFVTQLLGWEPDGRGPSSKSFFDFLKDPRSIQALRDELISGRQGMLHRRMDLLARNGHIYTFQCYGRFLSRSSMELKLLIVAEDVTLVQEKEDRSHLRFTQLYNLLNQAQDYTRQFLEPSDHRKTLNDFRITPAETRIIEQVMRGLSSKEIAGLVFCSESTVKKHLNSIYKKINVSNRMDLVNTLRSFGIQF